LSAIRRQVQKAPRRGGHHRAFRIEPYPACRATEGIEPAVRDGAFRGFGQSLSGGDGRPCRRGDQRAGSGSRMRDSLHFLAVTGETREQALAEVPTLTELGFRVTPIDQIWYAMATPKVPDDRIAILSNAFAKAFEDKMLWEQMHKAGEYLKLLTRPQVEDMVGK